jgi:hypothetical protein
LWAYWPVRNVAREGQQREKVAKLLSNVVPWSASRVFTFPITRNDSTVWSSVMITTTFGRTRCCTDLAPALTLCAAAIPASSTSEPERTRIRLSRLVRIGTR